MKRKIILAAAAAALLATPAAAQRRADSTKTPAQIQRLLGCRGVADAAQRLACFDRETATLNQAMARRDLVVIDRERATAARRSLFGFSVPSFGGLFGGDENEVKEIQSTITAVANNADGGWTIRLADGSTWTQTDDAPLGIRPARGHKVVVRRGLLGVFRISVNGQAGFKAKRIG
ncbi:hypothetical protein [Sphingomonas sp.]|uniref:hypothetical protein n=1 Tax=Sphingomonas sp. TaxID=28214 RepID=UPI0018374EEF|nr:hypothetical protein [Sphingomonas sp.]MBA3511923.1 hypothetical protein [Sphingomonas sp.]